jgi:hypothetical protein
MQKGRPSAVFSGWAACRWPELKLRTTVGLLCRGGALVERRAAILRRRVPRPPLTCTGRSLRRARTLGWGPWRAPKDAQSGAACRPPPQAGSACWGRRPIALQSKAWWSKDLPLGFVVAVPCRGCPHRLLAPRP